MTKTEQEFQRQVREIGCIACIVSFGVSSPCDIHHLLRGGRRIGEMHVLGLCPAHHRYGTADSVFVSRHPWKSQFEAAYGTESELLKRTQQLVAEQRRIAA